MTAETMLDAILAAAPLTRRQAAAVRKAMIEYLTQRLQAEPHRVREHGLGTFSARHVAERPGRNPQTGETITIAAKTRIGFRPARDLAAAIDLAPPQPKKAGKKVAA